MLVHRNKTATYIDSLFHHLVAW